MATGIQIGGEIVSPGERATIELRAARLYTHTEMVIPVHVIHGKRAGPRLFISAAVHGDELNGVEIIRRLLKMQLLNRLRGVLIAVPVVNIFGFISQSRYLPDRRDLNRYLPGSEKGSLASRLADLFMQEIVMKCTYGIDLHTGSNHRTNLPQIRACLDDPETKRLAQVFGTPVILNADPRDGSLRQAATELGIPTLVYEGGEALRFDETAIRAGVKGILAVMRAIDMLPANRRQRTMVEPMIARSTKWVRAPEGGLLRTSLALGERVDKDQTLGIISDLFGEREVCICSPAAGMLIGRVNLPLVNAGDALFHIARFDQTEAVDATVQAFHEQLDPERDWGPPPY